MSIMNIIDRNFEPQTAAEYFLYLVIVPASMIGFNLSGIPARVKRWLFYLKYHKKVKFQMYSLRPIDCPACLTFWIVLLLSFNAFTALASFCLSYISNRLIERV